MSYVTLSNLLRKSRNHAPYGFAEGASPARGQNIWMTLLCLRAFFSRAAGGEPQLNVDAIFGRGYGDLMRVGIHESQNVRSPILVGKAYLSLH